MRKRGAGKRERSESNRSRPQERSETKRSREARANAAARTSEARANAAATRAGRGELFLPLCFPPLPLFRTSFQYLGRKRKEGEEGREARWVKMAQRARAPAAHAHS